MIGDNFYIEFEDGFIYKINNTIIRFFPNQKLKNNKLEYCLGKYLLYFKNEIKGGIAEKFEQQKFYIDNIEFILTEYNNNILECWAEGYLHEY